MINAKIDKQNTQRKEFQSNLIIKAKFNFNMPIKTKHTSPPGMFGVWEETGAPGVNPRRHDETRGVNP